MWRPPDLFYAIIIIQTQAFHSRSAVFISPDAEAITDTLRIVQDTVQCSVVFALAVILLFVVVSFHYKCLCLSISLFIFAVYFWSTREIQQLIILQEVITMSGRCMGGYQPHAACAHIVYLIDPHFLMKNQFLIEHAMHFLRHIHNFIQSRTYNQQTRLHTYQIKQTWIILSVSSL